MYADIEIDFQEWEPSWISDRNNFSYFWSTSHPNASYQVSVQEKKWKIDFQDGVKAAILDFRSERF